VLGARVGRVVRILRLVRIFKLYKAIYEARQARKRRKRAKAQMGEDDDLDWDDVDMPAAQLNQSRVSKKLSELTTRRVILLVLVMMLVLPWLRVDVILQSATSGELASDIVTQAFDGYLSNDSHPLLQEEYANSLLTFMFYHNWYAHVDGCLGRSTNCANFFLSALFWVGLVSQDGTRLQELSTMAMLPETLVDNFTTRIAAEGYLIYGYSGMPDEALRAISQPWRQDCDFEYQGEHWERQGISVIANEIGDKLTYAVPCPEDLRVNEVVKYSARLLTKSSKDAWYWAFYFDNRPYTRVEALFGIGVTIFVCVVLMFASIVFTNDADKLVLGPVENMIAKVYTIQKNPMNAMKLADQEFKKEELRRMEESKTKKRRLAVVWDFLLCYTCKKENHQVSETVILEKTIIKLGSLLALGFGEAGAEIIAASMRGVDSANVDVMRQGAKVWGIVGCVRIRDFSVATEVLQKRIMTFVNQIAEIVHGIVNETHGAANKNNGDMFLLIWRIRYERNHSVDHEQVARYADLSMYAFARILGGIHRSPVLRVYRDHPRLQQKLGADCRVNLSFGLHYGWAIEGAVGSEFKIDASYLSPNVSIAESVQKAADIYGVNILVAESVQRICTDEMGKHCRLIDKVKTTGSALPMKLFSIDLDPYAMVPDKKAPRRKFDNKMRFRVRQEVEDTKLKLMETDVNVAEAFRTHPDISLMRSKFSDEFMFTFGMGYQNYAEGEWQVAQRFLEKAKSLFIDDRHREDGPSQALLDYMDKFSFEAPSNWKGCRELGRA